MEMKDIPDFSVKENRDKFAREQPWHEVAEALWLLQEAMKFYKTEAVEAIYRESSS